MRPEQRLERPGLPASRAALRKRLADAGLGRLADAPGFRALPGIALEPGKPVRRPLPAGSTRLGGDPDLPAGLDWPAGRGRRPLAFLAQVRLADLAGISGITVSSALPSGGWLWFFADTSGPHRGDAVDCAVIHRAGRAALRRRPVPRDGEGDPAADVLPELGVKLRPAWSLPERPPEALEEAGEEAWWNLAHPDGIVHRLLGVPDAVQVPPLRSGKGKREILLLQLDSDPRLDLSFGDGGRLYLMAPEADAKRGDFRRCRAVIQSH